MSKNTSISLGDHFSRFVDQQLAQGRYGSASEVVRAGLRLLEEHEAKVKALQDQANAAKGMAKTRIEKRIAAARADFEVRSKKLSQAWALTKEALAA